MSLGSKIRDLRIQKGLTQSDLGAGLVTSSMISQIESDKAKPSYKVLEAIAERLETPLEYFLADIQTQLEQSTAHKVAKALSSNQKFEQAAELLRPLLENPSQNLNISEVKYDLALCCSNMGQVDEALFLLEQVHELASEKSDPVTTIRAYNLQALTEQQRYKYHRAIYNWKRARDYFSHLKIPEPFIQSEILKNLGDVYQCLGEYKDALTCYNEAHALVANSSFNEQIGEIYIGLGLSYQKTREYEKATEYAQYAQAIFEAVKNVKFSIDVKRLYGILDGEDGNYEKALAILTECQAAYQDHHYDTAAASVYGDIAALQLHASLYGECIENCQKAIRDLSADSSESGVVWRTLGTALNHLDKTEEAIQAFEHAVTMFSSCNRLADLADVYSSMSELYERQGMLEKANECLHNMKWALEENIRLRGISL